MMAAALSCSSRSLLDAMKFLTAALACWFRISKACVADVDRGTILGSNVSGGRLEEARAAAMAAAAMA